MIVNKEIKRYMIANISDHVDPLTGEVNATSLAEDACDYFNAYETGYEIPDEFFEISEIVATEYERITLR